MMRRVLFLAFICLLVLSGTAFAERELYKDSEYDFSSIHEFSLACAKHVRNIDTDLFREDVNPAQRVFGCLQNVFAMKNRYVIVPPFDDSRCQADLYITVFMLGTSKRWHALSSVRNVDDKLSFGKIGHKDFSWVVPLRKSFRRKGYYINDGYADIELVVRDRKTGKVVYQCRDSRKEKATGYDLLMRNICDGFVNDMF